MDSLKRKIKELENRIDKLEVKFEILGKYIEFSELDLLLMDLNLTSSEINRAIEVINRYSRTESLNNWEKLGITKYTIKKELEKISSIFVYTENVQEFISALANEFDDENYKILAERLTWKIIEGDIFNGFNES